MLDNPFRLNGRGVSFAGSLLPLPCGVTRHPKTVINRFEMAPPLGKARGERRTTDGRPYHGGWVLSVGVFFVRFLV